MNGIIPVIELPDKRSVKSLQKLTIVKVPKVWNCEFIADFIFDDGYIKTITVIGFNEIRDRQPEGVMKLMEICNLLKREYGFFERKDFPVDIYFRTEVRTWERRHPAP